MTEDILAILRQRSEPELTVGMLREALAQYPDDWIVYDIDGMSICEPS